jgi:hypothetical protein
MRNSQSGYALEEQFLDGLQSGGGAGNLDEQIGPADPRMQAPGLSGRRPGIVDEMRRDLEGHVAIQPLGGIVDRP